ncbi:SPOSA6832_02392 [Sporobolomyces salmonicolor]|uniref:SPOSA6832_02392-mRNA-1:cds n=1 Tax=Sporidiobolus salmonicolor TaxID=5005 RepID=A0A0D6EL74_SPOSA|nr:SPOSA6832_02392 [Sporobolomyces salmonicolor]
MEAYLRSTKPSSSSSSSLRDPSLKPSSSKPRPYASLTGASKLAKERSALEGGVREANKPILKTLGKEDNPITHSDAYSRALHVQLCIGPSKRRRTRSQVGPPSQCQTPHPGRREAVQYAQGCLGTRVRVPRARWSGTEQYDGSAHELGVRVGNEITNQGLKACVERQGGRIVTVASARCTHVFVTSNLSGSKAQKYLEARKKCGYRLVLPEWATECERRGRRVCEAAFAAPVKNELQESAYTIFGKSTSISTSTSYAVPSTAASSASSCLINHSPPRAHNQPTHPYKPPSPSSRQTKRTRLTVGEGENGEAVLSPSPSPRSQRKKRREKEKLHSWGKKGKGKGKDVAKEEVEDVLVLGSSDVEVETDVEPEVGVHVEEETLGDKDEFAEEEEEELEGPELDEWGMPPSGQRQR